jgi:hypothetical protein
MADSYEKITSIENDVMQKLVDLQLESTTYAHDLAITVDEQASIVGKLPGALTKNLFLRDKKHGLFLVTVGASRDVNMKTLGNLLKLSGSNLRLGDEELLKEKLGVIRGAVSPFALINDKAGEIKFCIDKEVFFTISYDLSFILTGEKVNIKELKPTIYVWGGFDSIKLPGLTFTNKELLMILLLFSIL